ncbi:MAG: chitobiase/beta-hexosaminidase C-terminal domain-containing protein [Candidatus Limisoma sp.]
MKKFLLSTMALVAAMTVSAATSTLDYTALDLENQTDLNGVVNTTAEGVSVTLAQEDGANPPKYYTTGTAVRCYAGNSITVAAPAGGKITQIDMTLRDYSYAVADDDSGYTTSSGSFTADPAGASEDENVKYTAQWTGTGVETVKITINNAKNAAGKWPQFHIRTITVTYEGGSAPIVTKCETPKFSVAEGTYYSPVNVELTTTTSGATIVYTLDGGAETTYAEAIAISAVGTHTLTAYAKADGLDNSDVATATYVIAAPVEVGSIDEFIMEGESQASTSVVYKWTFPVTVVKQMPSYTYVKDNAGGAMLIYGNKVPAYNIGDVIPAGIQGSFVNYNGLYEMSYPDETTFAAATSKVSVPDLVMKPGDITAADMNKVVYLDNVTLTVADKTLASDGGSIPYYTQKGWTDVVVPEDGTYDVIAAVAIYQKGENPATIQVYPIEFKDAACVPNPDGGVSAIAAANGIHATANGIAVSVNAAAKVNVFNAAGQLVKSANVAAGESTVNVPAGFYLVKVANTVAKVVVR